MIAAQPGEPGVVSYFVASFVPQPNAERLARLARRLPPEIEPHAPEHLHITWRSFDGLPTGRLAPLKIALDQVAARHGPLLLELMGGGVFAAGAVWARICPSPPIRALQADIDRALAELELPPASYPFVPHITLGVGAPGTRLPGYLHDLASQVLIEELVLTTTGSQPYRVVKHFPLTG
jgi:2'-5' RNA ligase